MKPVIDQELPLAAHNEEQFHMIMGMGNRMPVSAISGTGHVQKFRGAANCKGLVFTETVIISAHYILTLYFIDIDNILCFLAFCKNERLWNGKKKYRCHNSICTNLYEMHNFHCAY
jgi:hypothetical protein